VITPSRPASLRAVLFDLDGVLVDSYEVWYALVNAAADRFGMPRVSRETYAAIFGQGLEADAEHLYPGRTVAEIRAAYDEAMPAHAHLFRVGPETLPVLEDLGRRGLRRAVVTNTQDTLARVVLGRTGIAARVEAWAAAGGDLREKPAPDLLLDALRRIDVPPSAAVLVGDSRFDALAAEAAGCPFVPFDLRHGGSLAAALAPLLP
jgi:phosphoglycolate phosphatase-like HAD superfamily hydrolase